MGLESGVLPHLLLFLHFVLSDNILSLHGSKLVRGFFLVSLRGSRRVGLDDVIVLDRSEVQQSFLLD